MKQRNLSRRLIPVLLALMLILGMLPTTAFVSENVQESDYDVFMDDPNSGNELTVSQGGDHRFSAGTRTPSLIDSTPPTGKITVGANNFSQFLSPIIFNLFFKQRQTVEITAWDDSYEVSGYDSNQAVTIEYYLYSGDLALTKEDLNQKTFTLYEGPFTIDPDNHYVIYAKITDHAGNVTYISSNGIVLDQTPPSIRGITDGATYYTSQSVTAEDPHLQSVTVNQQDVMQEFVIIGDQTKPYAVIANVMCHFDLAGNQAETYSIVATDQSGNQTQYTVYMKPIDSLAASIQNLTVDTVTSDNRDAIVSVQDAVAALDTTHATVQEKEALQAILHQCAALLRKISNLEKETAALTDTVNVWNSISIPSDVVTAENKDALTSASEDLDVALESFSRNDTQEETAVLEKSWSRSISLWSASRRWKPSKIPLLPCQRPLIRTMQIVKHNLAPQRNDMSH